MRSAVVEPCVYMLQMGGVVCFLASGYWPWGLAAGEER